MSTEMPIPDYLPCPERPLPSSLAGLTLDLYHRLEEATSVLEENQRVLREQTASETRGLQKLVAALAAERFEFSRLMQRIGCELERIGASQTLEILQLFSRSWDESLRRAKIEVLDITGQPLTDELAAWVDVESSIPAANITETIVRETLTPLVKHEDKVIGIARIVTSVPLFTDSEEQAKL